MSRSKNPQELVEDLLLWNHVETKSILEQVAKEHNVNLDALAELIHWQREQQQKRRSRDQAITFDAIFDDGQYWK